MPQRVPLALGAAGQQHGRSRGGQPHAVGGDIGLDELHRVVDGHQRVGRATRRVDVHRDVLVGILTLEVEQLSHDDVGHAIVDRGAQEHDALLEQPAVDVECALSPRGLFNDGGNEIAHWYSWHCPGSSDPYLFIGGNFILCSARPCFVNRQL